MSAAVLSLTAILITGKIQRCKVAVNGKNKGLRRLGKNHNKQKTFTILSAWSSGSELVVHCPGGLQRTQCYLSVSC